MAFHRNAKLLSPGVFITTCLRSTSWFGYMISAFLLVQAGAAFILTLLFVCFHLRCLRGLILTKKRIRNKYADCLYYYSWQSFIFSELGVKAVWRSPSGAEEE